MPVPVTMYTTSWCPYCSRARALLKRTQLRIGLGGYETAVKELKAEAWPRSLLPRSAVQLYFAHALIRDAAYAGMLARRRRELHGRLADQLALSPEVAAPGLIAAHRVASGDLIRAIPLLRDAAASAHALGALTEAAAFWRQAADLGATDDPAAAAMDRARADGVGV